MTHLPIPYPLQRALSESEQKRTQQFLLVETGQDAVNVALWRATNLVQREEYGSVEHPSTLLLLSNEYLTSIDHPLCESVACLDEERSPREDLPTIADQKLLALAATPTRAIDHLRRDNIDLSQTKYLLVAYAFFPQEEEDEETLAQRRREFIADVQYILTKVDRETKVEFFVDELTQLEQFSQELGPKSLKLERSLWENDYDPIELIRCERLNSQFLANLLYARRANTGTIVVKTTANMQTLNRFLRKQGSLVTPTFVLFEDFRTKQELPPANFYLLYNLSYAEILTLLRHKGAQKPDGAELLIVGPSETLQAVTSSKEKLLMNNKTSEAPTQEEIVGGKIELILAKVLADSKPEELDELKKLIRKHVPFLRRGYFTAYLLREHLAESTSPAARRPARRSSTPQGQSAREDAKTLYINVGKIKRLYAKEMAQLLQNELGISRQEIFSIRIHDKYSFVTLPEAYAEEAIAKLNGKEIKGRVATVSYARKA